MRLPRFVGAGEIFWPVGMHCMLVADLVLPVVKIHALLHDATEVVTNDIPQPMKTQEQKDLEHVVEARLYHLLGLRRPTDYVKHMVKEADIKACCAEGTLGCGPYAFPLTQRNYKLDSDAERFLQEYLQGFNPLDCIDANGKWVIEYENRIREQLRWHREYEE